MQSSSTKPQFKFELDEPGTASATFSYEGRTIRFMLTNVCNPLGDLLSSIFSILITPSYLWGEEVKASVVWYNDELSLNWNLSCDNAQTIHVRISQTNGFFDDDESVMMDTEIDCCDFIHCIVVELDDMIKQVGLLNYQQLWQKNEFPLTYFLFLKKYLLEKGCWQRSDAERTDVLTDEFMMLLA